MLRVECPFCHTSYPFSALCLPEVDGQEAVVVCSNCKNQFGVIYRSKMRRVMGMTLGTQRSIEVTPRLMRA